MPNKEHHRRDHTNVRLVDPTHERLKAHTREGETLSGTVGRALDALEREGDDTSNQRSAEDVMKLCQRWGVSPADAILLLRHFDALSVTEVLRDDG